MLNLFQDLKKMPVSFLPEKLKHNGKMVLFLKCVTLNLFLLLDDNHFDVDMTLVLHHFHFILDIPAGSVYAI